MYGVICDYSATLPCDMYVVTGMGAYFESILSKNSAAVSTGMVLALHICCSFMFYACKGTHYYCNSARLAR